MDMDWLNRNGQLHFETDSELDALACIQQSYIVVKSKMLLDYQAH